MDSRIRISSLCTWALRSQHPLGRIRWTTNLFLINICAPSPSKPISWGLEPLRTFGDSFIGDCRTPGPPSTSVILEMTQRFAQSAVMTWEEYHGERVEPELPALEARYQPLQTAGDVSHELFFEQWTQPFPARPSLTTLILLNSPNHQLNYHIDRLYFFSFTYSLLICSPVGGPHTLTLSLAPQSNTIATHGLAATADGGARPGARKRGVSANSC